MPRRKRSWVRITGFGCGGIVFLAVLGFGFIWLQFSFLSGRALETQEELEEAYPTQADFTPWLDDAIPPERMERFLAIRRILHPRCEAFAMLRGGFESLDRRTSEMEGMDEEAAKQEMKALAGEGGGTLRRMLLLGRDVAEYSVARNEALIQHEMGLGEYTWIYVMAYYSWLGHRPQGFPVAKEKRARIFRDRVLGEVWAMARRHVKELADRAKTASGAVNADPEAAARLALWRDELETGVELAERIPFQDGLPRGMVASLAPYRLELEELFCPETGELEIMRTEKRFIKYEHR